MARIVVVGSLNMDLAATSARLPGPGETVLGGSYLESPGGKGANQAHAAARLGGEVAMIGCVGDDPHGWRLRESLANAGCDVTGVRTVAGPTGVALIFVSATGENAIMVAPGANGALTAEDVQAAALDGASHVLLQLESPIDAVLAAARAAKAAGAVVILDPAPAIASLPAELLGCVDILTPNEMEGAQLSGHARPTAEAARALQRLGPRAVILKLGARGCLIATDETTLVPAPRVDAVDTTAAGDVFNGALAVALSEGTALIPAAEFAVRAAAISVTRRGAQASAPTREEVGG